VEAAAHRFGATKVEGSPALFPCSLVLSEGDAGGDAGDLPPGAAAPATRALLLAELLVAVAEGAPGGAGAGAPVVGLGGAPLEPRCAVALGPAYVHVTGTRTPAYRVGGAAYLEALSLARFVPGREVWAARPVLEAAGADIRALFHTRRFQTPEGTVLRVEELRGTGRRRGLAVRSAVAVRRVVQGAAGDGKGGDPGAAAPPPGSPGVAAGPPRRHVHPAP